MGDAFHVTSFVCAFCHAQKIYEEASLLVQKFLKMVRENRFWLRYLAWIIVQKDTGALLVTCVPNLSGFDTKNLEKWGEMQLVAQGPAS